MTAPIELDEVRAITTRAFENLSVHTFYINGRPTALEMNELGEVAGGLHIKVWDADEPNTSAGADFLVTVQRLAHCDTHHRHFRATDRLCDLCVIEQMEGDQ